MRGTTNAIKPQAEHSLFSRQRTSSVERELASTPYAFTPKPIRQSDDPIQRAKESLLNPFEDDINVRLAKQRLFGQQERELDRPQSPTIFPSTEDFGRRLNKVPFENSIFDNDALSNISERLSEISSVRTVEDQQARYRRIRALAEQNVDRFYRSLAPDPDEEINGNRLSRDRSTSLDSDAVVGIIPPPIIRPVGVGAGSGVVRAPVVPVVPGAVVSGEAFTVLPQTTNNNTTTSEDQESTSSAPSSFKLPTTVRSHRNTAFAIVGETVVNGPPAVQAIVPAEPSVAPVDVLPAAAPPILNPGRVSPFRGKGFKGELSSRHTTPKTSTNTSPQRSRANSITKPSVSFERPLTPPRNYIKENIQEVKELSQFNKERNEEIAARKKFEEELEILKELGLISDGKTTPYAKPGVVRVDSRSRMISPSILHFENIPVSSRAHYEDAFDKFAWKPPTGKTSMRAVSRSQPQSKSGSPQHHSKIPRRQASVSPPRQSRITFEQPPSKMSNRISADGRFISNSTSSINDKRVFSVIMDDNDNPMNPELSYESRSRSSQNLEAPTSILKSKPPRSPSRLGPPPTSKGINSKRLSPIVATPDKSPAKPGVERGKSKTPTPTVTSPSRIPKRPSKSLATTPNNSKAPTRAPSRTPSRGSLFDSTSKKSTSVSKTSNKSSNPNSKTTSGRNSRIDMHTESKNADGKPGLKRINSRTSITSKMSTTGKPELTRTNSRTSLAKTLSRTNSIKSINEKPGTLRRKSSMKNLKEKSIDENASNDKRPKSKSPLADRKNMKDKKDKTENTDEINTQDSETQYDKLSQLDMSLIPMTKSNIISMTTAAITAQPLEIAAKVTSQLPAAFEKAREKGIFDRNSSSDSIAAKMLGESTKADDTTKDGKDAKDSKGDKEKNLQKTASKTSLGSVKEEKEPMKKGGMKLIPVGDGALDPQIEKVKMKIENILKSNQSSVVDLKARVEMDEKLAAERIKKTLEKAAEKVESDSKTVTEKAIIEKPPDKLANMDTPPSLKSDPSTKSDENKTTDAKPKPAEVKPKPTETKPAEEPKPTKEPEKLTVKNGPEKTMPPVEAVTPKTDPPKPPTEAKPQPPADVINVKESVIKKETLTPNVKVVNEKTLGTIDDGGEKVTETIVRGEPDVEVQSGNVSPAVIATNGKATTSKTLRNGTSFGSSNGSTNGTTNGTSISNGTTNGTKLPNSDPKGDSTRGAKSNLGSPVSDGITNGSDSHEKPAEKPPNICHRLLGGCAQKLPCCAKLACHKKQPELHIVDEKADKKKASKDTAKKTKPEGKGGALSKLNCCSKKDKNTDSEMANMAKTKPDMNAPKDDKAEEEPSPGCLSCCKKKNKIRDSSADRRNVTDERWWHKMGCCKSKQQKQQDWAARRDSILSTPAPPPGCFGKLKQKLSCKKGGNQSDESRRTSLFSKKRSLSQAVPIEDSRSKLDTSLIEHNSHMRGAIPALPVPLAWFCFVCNILVPGLGTICSGLFCLCFGRPRFGMYDGYRQRIGAFLIDLIVGIGQLFTVLFCLVGWGWSIWWGSMMIKVARKYKKLRLAALDPERAVPTTNNHRAART